MYSFFLLICSPLHITTLYCGQGASPLTPEKEKEESMSRQFAVIHATKCKGSFGGRGNHIDRTTQPRNADSERTPENQILVSHKEKGGLQKAVDQRIEEGYTGDRKLRSDAVKGVEFITSGSHDQMKKLEAEGKIGEWAKENLDFLEKRYGKENVVSSALHMDERTPHMHTVIVPLTTDGRLSCYEVTGNKTELKELQTSYAQKMEKYGLDRGVENSKATHTTVADYYKRLENPSEVAFKTPKREIGDSEEAYTKKIYKELDKSFVGYQGWNKQKAELTKTAEKAIVYKKAAENGQVKVAKLEAEKGKAERELKTEKAFSKEIAEKALKQEKLKPALEQEATKRLESVKVQEQAKNQEL